MFEQQLCDSSVETVHYKLFYDTAENYLTTAESEFRNFLVTILDFIPEYFTLQL